MFWRALDRHFGPVNTVSYSPDGQFMTSGGEDGYIRIHPLNETELSRLDRPIDAAMH